MSNNFTTEQLKAMFLASQAQDKAEQEARVAARNESLVGHVAALVDVALTESPVSTSEKSGWTGTSLRGLTIRFNDTDYTVALTVTDVAATATNTAAVKAAAKSSKGQVVSA